MINNIYKYKLDNILVWLFTIYAFVSLSPYFLWDGYVLGYASRYIIRILEVLIILFACLERFSSFSNFKSKLGLSFISLIMFHFYIYLVLCVQNPDLVAISSLIARTDKYITIGLFLVLNSRLQIRVFKNFFSIFVYSVIPGLIVLLLHYLGVTLPYSSFMSSIDDVTLISSSYRVYIGSVFLSTSYLSELTEWRLCGMLNEPGLLGTFSAIFFIATSNYNMSKGKRLVTLLSGILSFSLAFYLLSLTGTILKKASANKLKSIKYIITFIVLYCSFISFPFSSPSIQNLQQRIEFSGYVLAGDNREYNSFKEEFDYFINEDSYDVVFGKGDGAKAANVKMASSSTYKSLIYDYGFVGFSFIILWFTCTSYVLSRKKLFKDWNIFALFAVFLLSIYQRPVVIEACYFVLLFGGIRYISIYDSQSNNS